MEEVQRVDLNADLGEEITDDAGLLAVVTSANVACGFHAGNAPIMRAVCAEAARLGVAVGAQVSYADRENFGRVPLEVPYETLRGQVEEQVGTLSAIAVAEGTAVSYVKPHGALYHRTMDDAAQAAAVLDGSGTLPVLGMPGSEPSQLQQATPLAVADLTLTDSLSLEAVYQIAWRGAKLPASGSLLSTSDIAGGMP